MATTTIPSSSSTSTSQITLTRLLTHLDATLSSYPSSSSSNHNNYNNHNSPAHRARIAANLEHARTLLLTSEKSLAATNPHPRGAPSGGGKRGEVAAGWEEFGKQREWIRRLEGRLRELGDMSEESDSESEDGDGEDLLRVYAPAQRGLQGAGLDIGGESVAAVEEEEEEEETMTQSQSQQSQQQSLRARKGLSAKDNRSVASSSAREELFSNRPSQQTTSQEDTAAGGISKTETLMSHNRTEQEALTTGLLGLASALKQSSINFSSSLEAERDVMKGAEGGLDKSAVGMEAAGKKMGTLRRMSEGQGWWGRIKLYAFIFALWVACFLLVFIGPKLRF